VCCICELECTRAANKFLRSAVSERYPKILKSPSVSRAILGGGSGLAGCGLSCIGGSRATDGKVNWLASFSLRVFLQFKQRHFPSYRSSGATQIGILEIADQRQTLEVEDRHALAVNCNEFVFA